MDTFQITWWEPKKKKRDQEKKWYEHILSVTYIDGRRGIFGIEVNLGKMPVLVKTALVWEDRIS